MFYIGQKVVCIKTSKDGATQKNKIYEIEKVTACKCGTILELKGVFLDLGFKATECSRCNMIFEKAKLNAAWRFKPFEEKSFADEVCEKINKELELTEAGF